MAAAKDKKKAKAGPRKKKAASPKPISKNPAASLSLVRRARRG